MGAAGPWNAFKRKCPPGRLGHCKVGLEPKLSPPTLPPLPRRVVTLRALRRYAVTRYPLSAQPSQCPAAILPNRLARTVLPLASSELLVAKDGNLHRSESVQSTKGSTWAHVAE